MRNEVITVRVGEIELLVEVSRPVGTENTSSGVGRRVVDAFDRAQDAIVAVSATVATTVSRLAGQSIRPDRVEVGFGLKFTTTGNVIVASGSSEVALSVVVSYDPERSFPQSSGATTASVS